MLFHPLDGRHFDNVFELIEHRHHPLVVQIELFESSFHPFRAPARYVVKNEAFDKVFFKSKRGSRKNKGEDQSFVWAISTLAFRSELEESVGEEECGAVGGRCSVTVCELWRSYLTSEDFKDFGDNVVVFLQWVALWPKRLQAKQRRSFLQSLSLCPNPPHLRQISLFVAEDL